MGAPTMTAPTISILKVLEEDDAYFSDANVESFDLVEKREAHLTEFFVLSPRDLSDGTYLTLPSEDNEQFIEGSKATSTTSPTISILEVEEAGDAYLSDANSESFDVAEKGNAQFSKGTEQFIECDGATTTTAPTNSILDSLVVSGGLSEGVSNSVLNSMVVSGLCLAEAVSGLESRFSAELGASLASAGFESCFSAELGASLASALAEKVQNDGVTPTALLQDPVDDSFNSCSSALKTIPIRQVFSSSGSTAEWHSVPLSPLVSPRF